MSLLDGLFAPHSDEVDQKNLRMLGLMLEMAMSVPILASLAEFAGVKLKTEDRRFLYGPFVLHGQSYRSDLPNWMFDQGRAERWEIVVEKKPGIIGPTEMTAVMYRAMLDAPVGTALTELYLWASVNACVRHYRRDRAELWQSLNMAPIEDKDVIERGGRLWHEYQTLSEAIRRKVVRAQQQREHEDGAQQRRIAKLDAEREAERERRLAQGDGIGMRHERVQPKPDPVIKPTGSLV